MEYNTLRDIRQKPFPRVKDMHCYKGTQRIFQHIRVTVWGKKKKKILTEQQQRKKKYKIELINNQIYTI